MKTAFRLFMLSLIATASAATAQTKVAPEVAAYTECAWREIKQLDDGISPADQIATVAVTNCFRLGEKAVLHSADNRALIARYGEGTLRDVLMKLTIDGVLRYRQVERIVRNPAD
jgi:hypothetical protein